MWILGSHPGGRGLGSPAICTAGTSPGASEAAGLWSPVWGAPCLPLGSHGVSGVTANTGVTSARKGRPAQGAQFLLLLLSAPRRSVLLTRCQ